MRGDEGPRGLMTDERGRTRRAGVPAAERPLGLKGGVALVSRKGLKPHRQGRRPSPPMPAAGRQTPFPQALGSSPTRPAPIQFPIGQLYAMPGPRGARLGGRRPTRSCRRHARDAGSPQRSRRGRITDEIRADVLERPRRNEPAASADKVCRGSWSSSVDPVPGSLRSAARNTTGGLREGPSSRHAPRQSRTPRPRVT